MSKRMTEAQLRARMTPREPSRESHEADVQFARQRLQRAAAKRAVAEAEHDEADRYLQSRLEAQEAFIAAHPDAQMSIFP